MNSKLGWGSRFHFTVRMVAITNRGEATQKQRVAQLQSIKHSGVSKRSGMRVLVAEDNLVNQKLISKTLEHYGFQVYLANDGATAVE